jgi:hypothetical protein
MVRVTLYQVRFLASLPGESGFFMIKSIVERYEELTRPSDSIGGSYRYSPYNTNVNDVTGTLTMKQIRKAFKKARLKND